MITGSLKAVSTVSPAFALPPKIIATYGGFWVNGNEMKTNEEGQMVDEKVNDFKRKKVWTGIFRHFVFIDLLDLSSSSHQRNVCI